MYGASNPCEPAPRSAEQQNISRMARMFAVSEKRRSVVAALAWRRAADGKLALV